MSPPAGGRAGQASIELLAAVPAALAGALILLHLLAAGGMVVALGTAAEAGAVALAGDRDPVVAARGAVAAPMRHRLEVHAEGGMVEVSSPLPSPFEWLSQRIELRSTAYVLPPGD
jgi:hypothetical protein